MTDGKFKNLGKAKETATRDRTQNWGEGRFCSLQTSHGIGDGLKEKCPHRLRYILEYLIPGRWSFGVGLGGAALPEEVYVTGGGL